MDVLEGDADFKAKLEKAEVEDIRVSRTNNTIPCCGTLLKFYRKLDNFCNVEQIFSIQFFHC